MLVLLKHLNLSKGNNMEFLRFGSSIPGSYWGCCACCIIQNFKVDPDAKASIQLVSGDGGGPVMGGAGYKDMLFAGPTYKDIFHQRLRIGTFSSTDMPNHAFLAILTEWQINSTIGKKWLEILREAGFEFIRTVNNSVYSGASLGTPTAQNNNNDNHIFGLFRNIGYGALKDPFTPPKAWTDLPQIKEEVWESIAEDQRSELTKSQHKIDTEIWNKIGKPKFLTEKELEAAGVPITYAGLRSKFPQQPKDTRLQAQKVEDLKTVKAPSAFPTKTAAA